MKMPKHKAEAAAAVTATSIERGRKTPVNAPLAAKTSESLEECAEAAVRNHELALKSEASALEFGQKAIQYAIAAGRALDTAKAQLNHGEWLPWLKKNVPDISEVTANRYRRLAKESHETDLSRCESLRQAYIRCGITNERRKPEPAPKTAQKMASTEVVGKTAVHGKPNLSDITVSVTEPAAEPKSPEPQSHELEVEVSPERDLISFTDCDEGFAYQFHVKEGKIRYPSVEGEHADKIYTDLRPVLEWFKDYEAAHRSQKLAA